MPWKELGYAVGVLTLLAAIYVGSYYAMVEREFNVYGASVNNGTGETKLIAAVFPKYRWGDKTSVAFFSPAFEIDRRLRPDYWKEPAYLDPK